MNVLVTGGSGYIGSVTVEQLLDRGCDVVVFDNLERGHRAAIDPRARLIEGDLCEAGAIRSAMDRVRPDAVMHFAAYALVAESMQVPERYFRNNVVGGVNLLDAMLACGVPRIVFSSTCAVYGRPERVPITEDHPQRPVNPYGESKWMFEKMLRWHEECRGLQWVALRYFNAAGATVRCGEDHAPETHLIPNILRVALGQADRVSVYGDDYDTADGTAVRDYIHILDLAQAHILALEGKGSGVFNLGAGTGFSVNDVLSVARAVTGHPIPAVMCPRRPGDPDRLVADARRARELLGWKPAYPDLQPIIASAWAWHRAHPRGYAA